MAKEGRNRSVGKTVRKTFDAAAVTVAILGSCDSEIESNVPPAVNLVTQWQLLREETLTVICQLWDTARCRVQALGCVQGRLAPACAAR